MFKCKGPTGTPVFQETPCAGEGQALQVKPASGAAPVPTKPAATATEGSAADSRPPETLAERINRNTETAAKERRVREVQGSFLPRAQALMSRCDSKARDYERNIDQLTRECTSLGGCKGM